MNKLRNIILVAVIAFFAYSCIDEPADPTIMGTWEVKDVVAAGQIPDGAFVADARLYLDPNETFLFVNVDGRATGGKWTMVGDSLNLIGNDEVVHNYYVMYYDWEKLHLYRTFTIVGGTDVELRYLFRRLRGIDD